MAMPEIEYERLLEWSEVLDDSTYYEILGVLEIADDSAVKAAFHRFALAFHPDNHLESPPEVQEAARRVFQRGAEAYRVLIDSDRRARYDMAVAKGELRLEASLVPRQAKVVPGVRSLEDLCRTAAGKMSARRADEALGKGDMYGAKMELALALSQEGGKNAELEERIDAIDLAMFAAGD
jgi:DnaJ-class molecular chaperone